MEYQCKIKIHHKNVGEYVNDDLFKFTEAHFKSGARRRMEFIPQKHRGFDKESGTRRSAYYANPLHARMMNYFIRQEKVEERRKNFAEFESKLAIPSLPVALVA